MLKIKKSQSVFSVTSLFLICFLGLLLIIPGISLAGDQANDYLNKGVEKSRHQDYQGAIEIFEKGLQLAREVGNKKLEKIFLNNIDLNYMVIYEEQGKKKYNSYNYMGAIEEFKKGLQLAKKQESNIPKLTFMLSIGAAYHELNDPIETCAFLEPALKIANEIGDQVAQASCLLNLGSVLRLFDLPKALSYFKQALTITQEIKKQALTINQERNNLNQEMAALAGLGSVSNILGEYPQTLSYHLQAVKIAKQIEHQRWEGASLSNIGDTYSHLGNYPEAISYYNQALKIQRDTNDLTFQGKTLGRMGDAYVASGDYSQALSYYKQAMAVKKERGDSTDSVEGAIGDVYLEQGDLERAYSHYKSTVNRTRLGRYYLNIKDYQKARNEFDYLMIPLIEKIGFVDMLLEYYIGLGLSYEGLQDYSKAREYYLKSVDFMEEQRDRLTELQRRNFFSTRIGGFKRIEPYEGLVRVSTYLKDTEAALYWAENTKARLLLEAMAHRTGSGHLGISIELSQKETDLISRIATTKKQMDAASEKKPERYRELGREIEGLKKERDSLIARLRAEYPEYASMRYPMPLKVSDYRLQPQENLIEYSVTNTASFAWLVRGGKVVKAVTIPIMKKDLTELANKYRGFFEGVKNIDHLSRFDPNVGKALYNLLLKDLAAELKPCEPVIIIPDGILGIIPFEALVISLPAKIENQTGEFGPYPTGIKYFGDEHPISIYQSATALSVVRTLKKFIPGNVDKMLVLADPDFGQVATDIQAGAGAYRSGLLRAIRKNCTFAPLPSTRRLAEKFKVANVQGVDLLLGANASEQQLKYIPLKQYRYQIYATHGILDNEIPYIKEPALVLSQVGICPEKRELDGFLTMTKVMDLKLYADLVALTACNTGVGKDLTGEGVMGMGRAFQYAGSKSVLMSLWSVEDESTNILTEKFFSHLKEGKDRLEALRLARIDLRQAGYEHPFFWAPFILVGER